jgi:hypothetical protein
MKRTYLLLSLMLTLLAAVPLRAQEEKPKPDSPKQSEAARQSPVLRPISWYRVDLTVSEFEDGKRLNSRHYTVHMNDSGDRSNTKFGTRVPVPTSGAGNQFNYIDVGLNITLRVASSATGERNMLEMGFELSSFAIPEQAKQSAPGVPILRQVQTSNSIPLVTSMPLIVASLDDPNSTKRYEFAATLTKL